MKLTEKKLKQLIKEAMEDEDQQIIDRINNLLTGNGLEIKQGIEFAGQIGISHKSLAFDKMKLIENGKVVVSPEDLLSIGNSVLEYYGDTITSYLRRRIQRGLEKGIKRRIDAGIRVPSSVLFTVANIIQNELTIHQRPINVIDATKVSKKS